jgi:hypothetical protein
VEAGHLAPGETITVDGHLDEPAWQHAGVIEDLTQQSPHPGVPTPYHTKVLLLRDGHTLYIGLVCEDPDTAKAATHTLVRDGNQANDDNVLFILDTFDTQRVAYVFQVNASGAMADGLQAPTPAINTGTGNSNGVDYNWDGIWNAVVTRDTHSWTAEIAIDTRSLQFTNSTTRWGFNVSRNVPRDLLTLNWSGTTLDSSVFNLPREGSLTGIQGMEQGKGLDFQPYGLAKYQTGSGTTSNTGFDLKYNFNPSLAGLFSYHTDFAEAEADQQQVNTGRFPLFFPEKRQFFLQGNNLFTFTYNQGTNFIPYYSRTIGLVNGVQVPLNEGAKLIGQSDSGSIALLDTQMAGLNQLMPGCTDETSPGCVPPKATNLFVGRGTYNLDPELQLGTLVTHGDPSGIGSNSFIGTDATWKTSTFQGDKNLNLSAWGAHSNGDALNGNGVVPTGNTNGYGLDIEYPNDLWYIHEQYSQYGNALNPALGFLPRPGTRYYISELNYQPRPSADSWFNWVHRFWWYGHYWEYDGFGGEAPAERGKQSTEWFFSPEMLTQTGWYWETDFYRDFDKPTTGIQDLVPGVNVPAGAYTYTRARLVFNSPTSKPLWWEFIGSFGTYYDGTALHPLVQVNWNTPSGRLVLSAQQELFFYYQHPGDNQGGPNYGVTRLSTLTGTYSFTPNLYITTQLQYNNGIPGVSSNTQLRWIVENASNIYLVWNHGLVTESTGLGQPLVATGNEVILKVQWDLRN